MDNPSTGGCLCGAIRYRISPAPTNVIACHCTHCRKISGAGSSHNAAIPTSSLRFTAGKPKMFVDTAASGNRLHRFFCAECGSSLYSQREKMPEMTILKVGKIGRAHV